MDSEAMKEVRDDKVGNHLLPLLTFAITAKHFDKQQRIDCDVGQTGCTIMSR